MHEQKLIFTYVEKPSQDQIPYLIKTAQGRNYSVERVNIEGGVSTKILEGLVNAAEIFAITEPPKKVEFIYQF